MGRMITFLIGHRGVGKTSFLKELNKDPELTCVDLDEEIEKQAGRTIATIFRAGEASFRKLESQTLFNLVEAPIKGDLVVALGAGFEGPLPPKARVIWLRRESDKAGRIFMNRPRLNK